MRNPCCLLMFPHSDESDKRVKYSALVSTLNNTIHCAATAATFFLFLLDLFDSRRNFVIKWGYEWQLILSIKTVQNLGF